MRRTTGTGRIITTISALFILAGLLAAVGCGAYAGRNSGSQCPECGSQDVIPIEYGLPGPEMREKAERGEIVLGG